jgi:hypothetical protein
VTKAKLLLSLAFIGAATSLAGCGRAHLSSNYGQSYTAWFATQTVNKKGTNPAESKRIIESLDAQEATAVSKTYRRGSSKSGDEGGSRMLMIGTSRPGGGSEGYMPPPSVPQ